MTFVHDDGSVDGEIFFHWEKDTRLEWPQKHLFFRLAKSQRTVEIFNVKPGDGVGEFKFKPTPGEKDWYKEITDRFLKLEEQLAAAMKAPVQPARVMTPEKRVKQ